MQNQPTTSKEFIKLQQDEKELKRRVETAIKNEQDAVGMYSEIFRLSEKIDPTAFGRTIKDILNQKKENVLLLKLLITKIDKYISTAETLIKDLKKIETEDTEYFKSRHGRR